MTLIFRKRTCPTDATAFPLILTKNTTGLPEGIKTNLRIIHSSVNSTRKNMVTNEQRDGHLTRTAVSYKYTFI